MIDDALLDAEEKMEKAVNVAKEDMGSIRTGRANPASPRFVTVARAGAPGFCWNTRRVSP